MLHSSQRNFSLRTFKDNGRPVRERGSRRAASCRFRVCSTNRVGWLPPTQLAGRTPRGTRGRGAWCRDRATGWRLTPRGAMSFGGHLRALRGEAGLSRAELARRAGIPSAPCAIGRTAAASSVCRPSSGWRRRWGCRRSGWPRAWMTRRGTRWKPLKRSCDGSGSKVPRNRLGRGLAPSPRLHGRPPGP